MNGQDGNDYLEGGVGADTLVGGKGSDSYIFGRGWGRDVVKENDTTPGNTDVLKFSNIRANELFLRRVSDNLEVSALGSDDKVTIDGWYRDGNAHHVEQFKSGDGKTLSDSNVDKLVQAMAAFVGTPMSTSALLSNYQTVIFPVLAANWQ